MKLLNYTLRMYKNNTMINYIKIIAVFAFLTCFNGCKTTKDVNRQDEERTLTETLKTTTIRKGDTVRYEVPNIILKDTTITIRNYKTGTTQVLRYNEEGKLTAAECISGLIEIIEENNRILIENINNLQKHKETEISPAVILYAFIGLALFLVIIFFVFFMVIKKYLKTIIPV